MFFSQLFRIATLLAAALSISSFASTELIDDGGRRIVSSGENVSSEQQAPRVASISTFGAELSLALGIQPVAVSAYPTTFPTYLRSLESIPSLGSRARTSFEALYNSKPTIVIGLERMISPYYQRYAEIAPTYGFDLITLEDSLRAVEVGSAALGQHEQGKLINQCFLRTLDNMKQQIIESKGDKPLTGMFLTSAGVTPRAYYSDFMTVSLMEGLNIQAANGASPYSAKTPFSGQVGLEWLMKLDPDVIFMYDSANPQFTQSKVWKNLSAVKNQRVYRVDMTWREAEGPYSRLWVAMDIAHKTYPELFPAPTLAKVEEALCLAH
ncbi:ABC transporter substrate-binding protein [Vibrio sp. SCSIO 43140]|uniref:ABC transporter substrate-binding protein n=1 Tax=Vibrio sp. SCSIO 43140 TaxID=2819100 RepID=UPI002074E2B1|nr:ABC transporter substrate-binding protein [Vibrio sp. SCSIO 43140]USD61387.1 ABC transporter substrate-binding protein [Vibrio sp. SCSIO 43140]